MAQTGNEKGIDIYVFRMTLVLPIFTYIVKLPSNGIL